MSTPNERLAEIEANYWQAAVNWEADLARTRTIAEAAQVNANKAAAHDAVLAAVDAGLTRNAGAVEAAYTALVDANASVQLARQRAIGLATLLRRLAGATDAARALVTALRGR